MYKKYKFPLHLFVIFEKLNVGVFTSEVLTANHYVCVINSTWYYGINNFLRKDVYMQFGSLIEMSAIDTLKYSDIIPSASLNLKKNRLLAYNIYYCYFTKLRLTLFYSYNIKHVKKIQSIENLYKNSNWLEREVGEMFSVAYIFKKDVRSLLLDYSKNEYPMLKDFPTEGFNELYYDFFDQNLHYINSEHFEL